MKTQPDAKRAVLGKVEVDSHGEHLALKVEAIYPGYVNGGGVAVLLSDEEGPYATLSANAMGVSSDLPDNEFCAKVWAENEHMRSPMLASGLFEDTGRRVPLGHAMAEVWRIPEKHWEAMREAYPVAT